MLKPDSKGRLIWRIVRGYLPFVLMGTVFGNLFFWLFIASVAHLVWFYYHQRKLLKWLFKDKKLTPPEGTGSWESVFQGIYNLMRRRLSRERELAQRMKYFRLGAEALPDAIVVFDDEGHILWCNRLATKLVGLKWPVDSGQHIANLIRPPVFVAYINQRRFDQPLEIPSPERDGQLLEFRVMPYSQRQYLMVVRDVTQLRQLEKMRKHFVSNVSHELRTPLTVLRGYLEMLDHEQPDEMIWPRAQKVMLEQTTRMDNLVNQLLTLARIEAMPAVDHSLQIDVPSQLVSLENESASLARDKSLTFEFNVDPTLWAKGDADQLCSAFTNLVSNAIKYCKEPGHICVSWQRCEQGARFAVRDSGPGIEPHHLMRLTERFYRVDKARSRDTGGAGLGLSIVKHALQHHDSELFIESQMGKGSCFSFVIPNNLIEKVESKSTQQAVMTK